MSEKIMKNLPTILKAKTQLLAVKALIKVINIPSPLVFMGTDSSLNLCRNIQQLGIKNICIVTDAVLLSLGVIQPIQDELKKLGVSYHIFDEVKPDPTSEIVEKSILLFKRHHCDGVLAVGGGSTIDTAKVLALSVANNKSPKQLFGILKARKPALPLFVIPTTAGTGSEVTIGAVISDSATHVKNLVIDPKVVPISTALDPKIMQGLPASITAETGVDALTHAIESWVSGFATKESDYYASAATKLIFDNLATCCKNGADLNAREAMALASHYAGIAMNTAGIGYVHALAHQLGTQYQIPHGRANAIVLPHVLEFNRKASEKRLALLAKKIELVPANTQDSQAASEVIACIKALLKELNINMQIQEIKSTDFPSMIESAFIEAHGTYNLPKYMNYDDAERILNRL